MAWYSLFVLKVPLNNKQTNKQIVICVCRCRPGCRDYRRRWNCKGLPSRRQSHQQGLETSVILNVSDKLICCENVLWSETKFSNCLTGSCRQMCVVLLITFLVVSDLLCFFCIFLFCVYYFYLCVFLYFVFNFLHCSTGQKLMLSGRCILSILLFLLFLLCTLCTIS